MKRSMLLLVNEAKRGMPQIATEVAAQAGQASQVLQVQAPVVVACRDSSLAAAPRTQSSLQAVVEVHLQELIQMDLPAAEAESAAVVKEQTLLLQDLQELQ
jgi:hypothetical protein